MNYDLTRLKSDVKLNDLKHLLEELRKETEHWDKDENEEFVDHLLGNLVEFMDEADGYDFFGTEGWKHRFGFDD